MSASSSKENGEVKTFSPPLVPPDGGYGWVIVLGNAILTFVNTSVTLCFGLVYIHLVQSGYSNTAVSIIPALMNAFSNLLAPISTALSRYYSHRRLAMIGGITVSTGLFLCSFSSHIAWFYLCYGVIIGTGNSMVIPQGFLLSQRYFHKKRVAANGVSMLGGSLGFMIMPLLLTYFVKNYAYPGAFMLWSGITLNGLIGAALFQPVQWYMKPSKTIPLQVLASVNNDSSNHQEESGYIVSSSKDDSKSINLESETPLESGNQESTDKHSDEDTLQGRRELLLRSAKRRSRIASENRSLSDVFGTTGVLDGFGSALSVKIENMKVEEEENYKQRKKTHSKPVDDYCLICGITFPRIGDIIYFPLFKFPAFLIASFGSICNRMVYMCFVTYLPSIAFDIGITEKAPYLFSCMAISEFLGKIIISIISDIGFMPRRYFMIIGGVGSAISIFFITFATSFWPVAICCSFYGFCVGTQMCVGPVLLVEYLGVKLLPYTYGLLLFLNGIGGLIIFACTGIINDYAGDYISTYRGLSFLAITAPILWSIINRCPNVSQEDEESLA